MKRTQATQQRRQKVLEAALSLYQEGGEGAMTIEALANLSSTSVGSLYHHYRDKAGILAALYQHCLDQFRQETRQALKDKTEAEALVKGLVRHYLTWVETNPGASRLLYRERNHQALQSEEGRLRESTLDFVRELSHRVHTAVLRGEVTALAPALYQPVVLGPAIEFCRQWLSGRSAGLNPGQVAEALAEAAWKSLRKDPG